MDVDKIFDAIGKLSSLVLVRDRIQNKKESIRELEKRECGNCEKWMKSTCLPEKRDGQFKSCSSPACSLFEIKPSNVELANERKSDLAKLVVELEGEVVEPNE